MNASLNLASRPFVDRRPWRRLTALLWVAGVGLLAFNAVLYWGYLTGSADARAELAEVRRQLQADRDELDVLSSALARLDVESQNREVTFLNERIADRRFPWNRLFDDIEEALPWNTRLRSLAPQPGERSRRRRIEAGNDNPARVILDISGQAQDDEGLLALLDSLFDHPSFDDPKLLHESRQDASELDFTIAVAYTPTLGQPAAEALADDAEAAEATDDEEVPAGVRR